MKESKVSTSDKLMKASASLLILAVIIFAIYSFTTGDELGKEKEDFELLYPKYYEQFDETTFRLVYKGDKPVNVTLYNKFCSPPKMYLGSTDNWSSVEQGNVRTGGFRGYATSCIVIYNGQNVTFNFVPEQVSP